jgi:hypothetical protein
MNRTQKKCIKSNGRLFDALPLVVVRALVGDGDDVLFSVSLLALQLSLALFLRSMPHLACPVIQRCLLFLPLFRSFSLLFSFFFSAKNPTTTAHNETTTYFPSSSS